MTKPENGRYVTVRELSDKLDKMRWEMRCLVLIAVVGGNFVPSLTGGQNVAALVIAHIF